MGTLARHSNRRRAGGMAKAAMVLFFIGGLAVLTDLILFASGSRDLPLWLNLLCLLAPIGFGLGLYGVFRENRTVAARARADAGID